MNTIKIGSARNCQTIVDIGFGAGQFDIDIGRVDDCKHAVLFRGEGAAELVESFGKAAKDGAPNAVLNASFGVAFEKIGVQLSGLLNTGASAIAVYEFLASIARGETPIPLG